MKPSNIRSPWARFAFLALGIFWAAVAWFVLLQGGFHTTPKYTHATTFVDGAGALFMAFVFLLLAGTAAGIVLQSIGARRWAFVALGVLILVPPCLFLLQA